MPTSIVKHRRAARQLQSGCCYYCRWLTWEDAPDLFATQHRLTERQVGWFRSTAEHLVARCDGGSNASNNIVASCLRCNQTRHNASVPLDAESYRNRVQRRLAKGRWWPRELHQLKEPPAANFYHRANDRCTAPQAPVRKGNERGAL